MLSLFFGKRTEKIEFSLKETCQEKVLNPEEGYPYKKCGKPLIKDLKSGKVVCSVNELHNIKGPPEK